MSYSVKVTGVACSINCVYCYEGYMRKKTGNEVDYDLDAIERAMEARKDFDGDGAPTLHGGEPLMIPKDHVERLLRKMYQLHGSSGIQTNGVHIDSDHIEMFKRYNTHVGISFDGPWPLNKLRVAGRHMSTREATERTLRNIYRLRAADVSVGMIIVLHKANALPEPREKLKKFILEMNEIGVSGRLNLCIIDDPILKKKQELTEEEAVDAYRDLAKFILIDNDRLHWQPFRDVVDNLLGNGLGTCIFHPCSYYEADGERVIMGDGSLANCLKTAKTGYAYLREPNREKDHARELILPQIPWEDGGCKGCRYWRICYGVCPSEGIDGDWRNRSRFCRAYYAVYEVAEKALKRLMPNVQLVVDRPIEGNGWMEDYKARAGFATAFDPFELMTNRGSSLPSTWKGSAWQGRRAQNQQNNQYNQCTQYHQSDQSNQSQSNRTQNGHADHTDACITRYHGDRPHGDYTDHGDSG